MSHDSISHSSETTDRWAIIMFADLIGSCVFCNTLDTADYDKLISAFQSVAARVLVDVVAPEARRDGYGCDMGVRGDEACLIMFLESQPQDEVKRREHLTNMSRIVIKAALDLRRAWILDPRNRRRILEQHREPIGIGIGINCGLVTVGEHTRIFQQPDLTFKNVPSITPEGYSINLAKRIEGVSREGQYSRIFVSQDVYNHVADALQLAFGKYKVVELKGFIESLPVYEIMSAGHVEDGDLILQFERAFTALGEDRPQEIADGVAVYDAAVAINPRNFWLMMDLAHHHFDTENYEEAARLYRKALELEDMFGPAHMYLGRCHYRLFEDETALVHLSQAVEINPESARSNNFLGVCLRRLALKHKAASNVETEAARRASHLHEARQMLQKALEYHERAMRLGGTRQGKYIWAGIAHAHTFAELAMLAQIPGSGVNDIYPSIQQDLRSAQERVMEHLKLYMEDDSPHPGFSKKQNYLVLHTLGFVIHAQALFESGKRRDDLMAAAAEQYEKSLTTLREWDHKSAPLKYYEKLAEIERHFGSLYRAWGRNTEATDHYDKSLNSLYALQKICHEKHRCNRSGTGICRERSCDRAWTCLPSWWSDTLRYWSECKGLVESEWHPEGSKEMQIQ